MSSVDSPLDPQLRDALIDEVRGYLPAFLSAAGTERADPAGDVRELLGLRPDELDKVVAVHVCLTAPVRALHRELRDGLRHPLSASSRPAETAQAVRGAVDWGATVDARVQAGGDDSLYVTRTAERVLDTPGNRALAWLLRELDKQLRRADPRRRATATGPGWNGELAAQRAALQKARQGWLADVPPQRPDATVLRQLRNARTAFYAHAIPDAIAALDRFTQEPSPDDLTELLCERFFEPRENWRLFELVVALRLARAFAERSPNPRLRLLVGATERGPYAVYDIDGETQVRLHVQCWPDGAGASTHALARKRHGLRGTDPRPDIVIERTGPAPDVAILELKASEDPGYLREGLTKLLGYLKDRPADARGQPGGWLVAPASDAFRAAASSADCDLWIVDADAVATAASARFAP